MSLFGDGLFGDGVFSDTTVVVPPTEPPGEPILPGCVRAAWLVLGGTTLQLEDTTVGYWCTSLDFGYPTVREVVSSKPDMNGETDRTQFFGPRTVSADITTLAGVGARIDAVASSFAPFMIPSVRPELHYVLDRPGAAERVITVRGSGYEWPVTGPYQRDIHLQWVAADPFPKDPNQQTVNALAGTTSSGRTYARTYDLSYPIGGSAPSIGIIAPGGDVPVRPRLLVWGPVTNPVVTISPSDPTQPAAVQIVFQTGFIVGAGHYVEVDCYNKTVRLDGDPNQSVMTSVDWQHTGWPVINPVPPASAGVQLAMSGSSTSSSTQVQAVWNDRYLT